MNLTQEQQTIVNYIIEHHEKSPFTALINSVAGSGKTTLLTAISRVIPHTNGLYLSYNKSIAVEASHKFPSTTNCSTTHSLAYQAVVKQFGLKVGNFFYKSITEKISYEHKLQLIDLIKEFCLSSYTDIHLFCKDVKLTEYTTSLVVKYLTQMSEGKIECTHDFYLKYFHIALHDNLINYPQFDFVMIDEFGDVNEVTLEIFKLLPAKFKVATGDACIKGDSRVLTSDGWRKISSIHRKVTKGDSIKVMSYDSNSDLFGYNDVVNSTYTGEREVFQVKGANTSITGTKNHRLLTTKGYKRIDELSEGDLLLKYKNEAISKYSYIVSPNQYQILLGSYLGDGSISKTSPNNKHSALRLNIRHSKKQLNYLLWKLNAFDAVTVNDLQFYEGGVRTIRGKQCNINDSYSYTTKSFYSENPISIKEVYRLDPLGLAVWLMDDGSIKNRSPNGSIQGITISSCAFSYEDNLILIDMLKSNFDLQATINKDRDYFEINFNKVNSAKLLGIVYPYISNDFAGKFKDTESEVLSIQGNVKSYVADAVVSITSKGVQPTYDIEVEHVHNFIVADNGQTKQHTGVITHNCQNVYTFNHTINGFEALLNYPNVQYFDMTKSFRVASHIAEDIQSYCREFLDPDMKFEGVELTNPSIVTRGYITRTNSALIGKMIELMETKTPFSLVRKASDIFKNALMVCSFKYQGNITDPAYSHIQSDIDDWYENIKHVPNAPTLSGYLMGLHSHDFTLIQAIKLVVRYSTKKVFEVYEYAKSMEGKKTNLTLFSSHSGKGLEMDEVTIGNDMNELISKLLELHPTRDTMTEHDIAELNLGYVAASRARVQLNNAQFLQYRFRNE